MEDQSEVAFKETETCDTDMYEKPSIKECVRGRETSQIQ